MKTLCRHATHALCLVLMLSGHSARAQVAPVLKGAKDKRTEGVFYRPDANRQYVMMFDPSREAKFSSQLDERADYVYEAVTTTKGMVSKTPGVGQAYIRTYALQKDGSRLDGGKTYHLHILPNAPINQFWSVTLYDVDTKEWT
jgi:hypothetical protein